MDLLYITLADEHYTYKNWIYKDVCVNFSRMYYILEGEAHVLYKGRDIVLKKGFLYFFPAKKPYTVFDNPNCQLLHTYIHIITQPKISDLYEFDVKNNSFLQECVCMLRKHIHDTDKITAICKMIVSYLFDDIHSEESVSSQIQEFILSHLNEEFSIEAISRQFNYSKMHISRIFQKVYKYPPYEFYLNKKLDLGLKQLSEGSSVKEVAISLNYSSPAAFVKAFKKKFGLAPSQYIAMLKVKED